MLLGKLHREGGDDEDGAKALWSLRTVRFSVNLPVWKHHESVSLESVAVRREDGTTAVKEPNESWTAINVGMSSPTISASKSQWSPNHCRTMAVSLSSLLFALFN